MSVPAAVQAAYDEFTELVRVLQAIVGPSVQRWASSNDYLFKERIKTSESVAEKLETGRFPSWSDIDDLYGCTVVIPTTAHTEGAFTFLRSAFREVETRGQGVSQKPPDVFRFDAPRFIGTLMPQDGIERPPGVDDLQFEVQVLTAFEYAWVVATHDVIYKGGHVDWGHARLASRLKATAEEADTLIASFPSAAAAIPVSPHKETAQRERVLEFFKAAADADRIAATLAPESWSRFSENVLKLIRSFARDRMDDVLTTLFSDVDDYIEAGRAPASGSLFQLVTGLVASRHGDRALEKFVIVDSSELRDLYGIAGVPRPFVFTDPSGSGSGAV